MLPSLGFIQGSFELQICCQVKRRGAPYTWVCQKTPNFGFWSWCALYLGASYTWVIMVSTLSQHKAALVAGLSQHKGRSQVARDANTVDSLVTPEVS